MLTYLQDNVKSSDPFSASGGDGRNEEKQAMFIVCDFVESLLNYGFRYAALSKCNVIS